MGLSEVFGVGAFYINIEEYPWKKKTLLHWPFTDCP